VNKVKQILAHKKIRHLLWLVLTVFVLLGYSLQSAAGSVYYPLVMQTYGTVTSPPIILKEGTAGSSTIYTNSTSAMVRVGAGDFNYVLNMTENQGSDWEVRLSAYDQFNISRLSNCSIYIYDGSNSPQIVIVNGNYTQQTGLWYDLAVSDTEYIWMHVETTSAGTSFVYAYLETRVPSTTTYVQYIITFEIT